MAFDFSQSVTEANREEFLEAREALMEAAKNNINLKQNYHNVALEAMLSSALKSIYVTALEKTDIMDKRAYAFAESIVDDYIHESGGANAIMTKMAGKTYLLSRLASIVENAVEDAEETTDDDEKAAEVVPDECKEKMFDELEKEEEIDTAVDIIADRISSAEEEFVKKNAEDKQKIVDIVDNISERIKAAKGNEDLSDEEQDQATEELEQESTRLISDVYNSTREIPLFEFMVRQNLESIIKDKGLRDLYANESNQINIGKVVDVTSQTYGFLEFVNTIKLEKVDQEYVENLIKV